MKGLKVAHDLTEFKEGETTILTLKDSFILKDNYQYNEEEDELEDITKTELSILEERKKPSGIKYNPIKELELSNSNAPKDNDTSSSILSKYNEKEKKKGIVLDGEMTSGKSKEERLQEIRSKLSSSLKKNTLAKVKPTLSYNLNDDQLSFSNANSNNQQGKSDIKIKTLAKPQPTAPVAFKKRKNIKKKEENIITPSNPLISELLLSDIANIEENEEDYGSRTSGITQQNTSLKEKMEKQKKKDAYSKALDKAKKVSLSLLNDDESLFHDDNELFESIENSRKQFLAQNDQLSKAQLIERAKSKWKEREHQEIELMNSSDPNIFSTTREFCRNISTSNLAAEKKEPLEIPETTKDEDEDKDNMEIAKEGEKEEKEDKSKDLISDAIIEEEPAVSEGLFSALKLFEKRGVTAQKDREMYVGRKGDPVDIGNDPAPHINLEHRDEFGRILTQREIFRKISHKFHGKLPGKNKLEKNLKKYKEELKLRNMSYDDTPLRTVEKMRKEQERTGLAFVELSGNVVLSSTPNEPKNANLPTTNTTKTSKMSKMKATQPGQKIEFGFTGKRKANNSDPSSSKKIKF